MSTTQTGEVVFYNGKYGFVRLPDESSLFFTDSQLNQTSRQQLRLLDQVSFRPEIVAQGLHQGKLRATMVRRLGAGDPSHYRRVVGVVQPGSKEFKRLISPQLSKPVLLHYNRLFERHVQPQQGELMVFSPVVSSKNANELFAFFAYPLSQENDVLFLQEQLDASHLPGIQTRLDQVLAGTRTIPVAERFAAELRQLGPVHHLESYRKLVELLKTYAEQNYRPLMALLHSTVSPVYQIMLWENRLVDDFVPDTMHEYFLRAPADRKRDLVGKMTEIQRQALLEFWTSHLMRPGHITRVNNGLKTYLDVVFRDEQSRNMPLYQQLYKALNLEQADWQQLYQHGYVHQIPTQTEPTDIPSQSGWLSRSVAASMIAANQAPQLLAHYESELLGADVATEAGQLQLALVAKLLAEFFPAQVERIQNWYWPRFTALQRLVLWLVEVGPNLPDAAQLYKVNCAQLSVFLRLRFYLSCPDEVPQEGEITVKDLREFAATYRGHNLVGLVRPWTASSLSAEYIAHEAASPYFVLLDEISELQLARPEWEPTEQAVAAGAYATIPPYQSEHIRLYLHRLVSEEEADFVGFRQPFRYLSREEKQELKARFDIRDKREIWQQLRQGIVPCEDGVAVDDQQCYTATLENIYFERGQMQLRLPNGEFTPPFTGDVHLAEKASRGLNSLPVESLYNQIPLKVWVKEGAITFVEGLAELFELVMEEEIAFTFGKKLPGTSNQDSTEAYAEDWQLRQQVLAYLAQVSTDTHLVAEPRNYRRQLDEDSGIDAHEKTALYIIPTDDGVGIVWENVDFSDDRSTYVFKAHVTDLPEQLEKLKQAISTHAQWRSTLSGGTANPTQADFRNYYGYLARIRKQRGRNQSFAAWQERLLSLLQRPVPPMPSAEAWELARQSAHSSTPTRLRPSAVPRTKGVVIIDESSLDRMNPDTLTRQPAPSPAQPDPSPAQPDPETEISTLLRALQEFNQFFCASLPHD